MTTVPVTIEDAERAYAEWGCNCGPGAIAAIFGISLDAVRPHIPDFDAKRYTNPTMMTAALRSIGRPFKSCGKAWPSYGLVRIQWEGPWTDEGVNPKWRYRQTHWVGSHLTKYSHGVFDINAINNGTGWCEFSAWRDVLVPHILKHVPRANGKWHVTHGIEVTR